MAEEKTFPHSVVLEERKDLRVSGVTDVDSFDEETVVAYTSLGELIITGADLHISRLDIETGDLSVEGNITSLSYISDQSKHKGLFSRLLK